MRTVTGELKTFQYDINKEKSSNRDFHANLSLEDSFIRDSRTLTEEELILTDDD